MIMRLGRVSALPVLAASGLLLTITTAGVVAPARSYAAEPSAPAITLTDEHEGITEGA